MTASSPKDVLNLRASPKGTPKNGTPPVSCHMEAPLPTKG